jgi:hypothetical protein
MQVDMTLARILHLVQRFPDGCAYHFGIDRQPADQSLGDLERKRNNVLFGIANDPGDNLTQGGEHLLLQLSNFTPLLQDLLDQRPFAIRAPAQIRSLFKVPKTFSKTIDRSRFRYPH